MSLAQLRPQPRPEFPLPNENFHLQVVSVFCSRCFCRFSFALLLLLLLPIVVLVVVVVVFYVSLIFLAHIIKVASQVASLPLVAREFFFFIFYFLFSIFLHFLCISENFSNPLFACGFLCCCERKPSPNSFYFFLLSQFSVMKTLQSFR